MTTRRWIVLGSLGGAAALLGATVLVRSAIQAISGRGPAFGAHEAVWILAGIGLAGLVLGGAVGARASRMSRTARTWLGGFFGATSAAMVFGVVFLVFAVVGASHDIPNGLAAFVTGAVVGAVLGLVLGAVAGSRERPQQVR